MPYQYFFTLAKINFEFFSDKIIQIFSDNRYDKYILRQVKPDDWNEKISACFQSIEKIKSTAPNVLFTQSEQEVLKTTVGFSKFWLHEPFLFFQNISSIIKNNIQQSQSLQIEVAWFRVLLRLYHMNKIFYFYSSQKEGCFADDSFHAILRNMISPFLPHYKALMIHSACVKFPDGKVAVFFAPDSGGKTTLVKQFKQGPILTDDQTIIKKELNSFYAYSTPFGRMNDSVDNGKIAGLFILKKGSIFSLSPFDPKHLFEFLWNEHLHIWHAIPVLYRPTVFQLLADFCFSYPIYQLTFPKNYVNWDAIHEVMNQLSHPVNPDNTSH